MGFLVFALLVTSCLEEAEVNLGVAEGALIGGYLSSFDGKGIVEIYKNQELSEYGDSDPVQTAKITLFSTDVDGGNSGSYPFVYEGQGRYVSVSSVPVELHRRYYIRVELRGWGVYESIPIQLTKPIPDVEITETEESCGGIRYGNLAYRFPNLRRAVFEDPPGKEGKHSYMFLRTHKQEQKLSPFDMIGQEFLHRRAVSNRGAYWSEDICETYWNTYYIFQIPREVEHFVSLWVTYQGKDGDYDEGPLAVIFEVPATRTIGNIRRVSGEGDQIVEGVFFPTFSHKL